MLICWQNPVLSLWQNFLLTPGKLEVGRADGDYGATAVIV